MVADNNKQQTPEAATPSLTTNLSEGGRAAHNRKLSLRPKRKKKYIMLALLLAVILIAGGTVLKKQLHIGDKVYAQAAGHKIYKEDVKDLIGNTKGVSDRQAATVLADKYLTEAMAKDADITVSNKNLVDQYGQGINKLKTTNPYMYQRNVNIVYFDKLSAYNSGLYKGKLLVANFSQHIAYESLFLNVQKAGNPLLGNPEAIAQDKKYAYDFITKLYNQVKSGKITFDQAIKEEQDDPRLGLSVYQGLVHSGAFDTSNVNLPATALILPNSIQQKIQGMKAGELSKPFAVKVSNSLTDESVMTDSYYLVVRMDSTSGSHSGLSYDQYLKKAKKDLGYKVYV